MSRSAFTSATCSCLNALCITFGVVWLSETWSRLRQRLTVVERGRFLAWMRARGKNKVPRLVNDRRVADEILAFQTEQAL